ncbi:MAG: PIN domain-containing protein [Gammaproteobacteria bacterium]|nr:PIN domain-containing protein [Gammaproteobacteria bacterium]
MNANFFDSNILIYMFDETAPQKQAIAKDCVAHALITDNTVISYQVVQETLNVITTKLQVRATPAQVNAFLADTLAPLWKINPSVGLYQHGLKLQSRYQYRFYDSLIIAAALEAGCRTLYSEDLQHGQTIEQLTIKNPFRETQDG